MNSLHGFVSQSTDAINLIRVEFNGAMSVSSLYAASESKPLPLPIREMTDLFGLLGIIARMGSLAAVIVSGVSLSMYSA